MSILGGILLGALLFGGRQKCDCKNCIKKRKADVKWWREYYKKHPQGLSASTSCSVSTSPNTFNRH